MLRKLVLALLPLTGAVFISAQNLQLHFDPRNSLYGNEAAPENYLTATFEIFKPDKLGSTFMFVDFDLNGHNGGIGLVYTEISRTFAVKNFPLMPHIEFNGGLGSSFSIPSAYLVGMQYPFQLGAFDMATYVAYKLNAFEKLSHDMQWTLTWNVAPAGSKLSFGGFVDVERKQNPATERDGKRIIF